ncbi:MAG: helix-turn-helix transcriptional regulator [Chthoniobacterales bacterium]|nr:helix-turn-helix transcriptional regulator [Chthoniobacterales bacterium]
MNFPWVEIWDRLEGFDASRTDEALSFLMRELKRIARADDAVWIGVVRMAHGKEADRDHQLGWRGRVVVHLEWTDLKRRVVAGAMKAQETDGGVPSSIEMAKRAGQFRTLTLRELHDMKSFRRTEHYRACFVPFGITDRLWCVFPVNEDCEVAYILDRCGGRRFSTREKNAVASLLRPIRWFHRRTMLFHGVTLGDARLRPGEIRLLSRLLSPRTEKEIAEDLGLAPTTTRTYIKQLYAKFGVRGRAGLASLWLGHPG